MRMVCPDCAAEYEVPDRLLTDRKSVRCAKCGGSWSTSPVPPSPLVAGSPIVEPAEAAEPRARAAWQLPAAWVASLGAVGVLLALLMVFHNTLGAAWPPLLRLYGAIGLG